MYGKDILSLSTQEVLSCSNFFCSDNWIYDWVIEESAANAEILKEVKSVSRVMDFIQFFLIKYVIVNYKDMW